MIFRIFRAGLAISAALFLTAQFLVSPAQATEGYFQHGYGVASKALAGAGVATSQDAMTQALNPAGLVGVENQLNVGFSFFSPLRSYEAQGSTGVGFVGDGSFDSGSELFIIPNIGVSYQIDDVSAAGFALYGNGGMNTQWKGSTTACAFPALGTGTFCGGTAGVDLAQAFIQATYAREIIEGVRIGVGPILAIQRFEAKGLVQFGNFGFSSDPSNLTDNEHDTSIGFGGRFGIQADVLPTLSVGAAYQMRTYMDEFEKYAGLFAEQGDFDIPAAAQAGVAWQATPELLLLLDFKYIWYSDIAAVGNAFSSPGFLGDDNGPGFGWEDASIIKLGAQWEIDDTWTVRGGYSYTDQPIPDSEVLFNILAPGVMEHHFTAGANYVVDDSISVNFGGFFAPNSEVSGTNPLDPGQTITIEMTQIEVSAGIAWRF